MVIWHDDTAACSFQVDRPPHDHTYCRPTIRRRGPTSNNGQVSELFCILSVESNQNQTPREPCVCACSSLHLC